MVSHLIYPVPDAALPFLGIHLTPMIDGGLTVGPNAVLSLARERYGRRPEPSLPDMASYLSFPGFWKLVRGNLGTGIDELRSSLSKRGYLSRCRRYCPSLELDDLESHRPGIRAQAVSRRGDLIHDFTFLRSKNALHVCNAPSPAATSAIPIGRAILERIRSEA